MKTDETSRFKLSANEIARYPWQDILKSQKIKECNRYHEVFGRAARDHKETGDFVGERVYSFLHGIASFYPTYDNRSAPYRSMRIDFDGSRSLNPEDLTDQDLDALQGILHEIEDPEFRARVADVLWVCRKDYKSAQTAIHAFLESAQQLKSPELWPPYVERLDRAAQLAVRKGFEVQCATVVAAIEADIQEYENDPKAGLLCARLMGILLLLEEGDINRYVTLAERLAREFTNSGEWHFSEHYWQVAEHWHRRSKDEAALQRCQIEAAECNVSRGEACLKTIPPQNGSAAHWMGKGFEALRRAKADSGRVKEVHRKFLSLQKAALKELSPFGFGEDRIPGLKETREKVQEESAQYVKGLCFEDALCRFAHIQNPTDLEQLKKRERESSKDAIWDKLFASTVVDRSGKVADIIPAVGFSHDAADAVALRKKLVQSATLIDWNISVEWRILPASYQISFEHPIRKRDLMFLVLNNPFIPQGHEGFYLRGIQAGFFGDWPVAMHMLVPQIEASVRHVLQQHGVVTSTRDSDGIQMEKDINQLLWEPEMEKIFGVDILFDLRGNLIEKCGCNMRNELAHGLMPEGSFYRLESIYIWWLVIRLCWIGVRAAIPKELPEEEQI